MLEFLKVTQRVLDLFSSNCKPSCDPNNPDPCDPNIQPCDPLDPPCGPDDIGCLPKGFMCDPDSDPD